MRDIRRMILLDETPLCTEKPAAVMASEPRTLLKSVGSIKGAALGIEHGPNLTTCPGLAIGDGAGHSADGRGVTLAGFPSQAAFS